MDSYTEFASLYDTFMEETPYDEWCDYVSGKLKKYSIEDGLVLELGAGTGEMTRRLSSLGYDMIGVDNSEEMLAVARNKSSEESDILYLCQDMREFELYGTVRAIVSICDCMNYILDKDELIKVFSLCNNYLDPGGILLFDFNTEYKYAEIIGNTTIAENREDAAFIWDNFYDEDSRINEYDMTFFVKEGELFKRFTETHFQRGYSLDEIVECVTKGGLKVLEVIDADTHKKPTSVSERIYVIACEQGKQ